MKYIYRLEILIDNSLTTYFWKYVKFEILIDHLTFKKII